MIASVAAAVMLLWSLSLGADHASASFLPTHPHWGSAYNNPRYPANTYRAFALHDRTDEFWWQIAIQDYVYKRNAIRARFNMALPWHQYDLAAGYPCYIASGEVASCSAHRNEYGVGRLAPGGGTIAAVTETLTHYPYPITGWTHITWARVWYDATHYYSYPQKQAIVCHEMGHAQGLDHSSNPASCMMAFNVGFSTVYDAEDNGSFNQLYGHAPPRI